AALVATTAAGAGSRLVRALGGELTFGAGFAAHFLNLVEVLRSRLQFGKRHVVIARAARMPDLLVQVVLIGAVLNDGGCLVIRLPTNGCRMIAGINRRAALDSIGGTRLVAVSLMGFCLRNAPGTQRK